jgi:hypothetical protein
VGGNIGAHDLFSIADRLVRAIREDDRKNIPLFLETTGQEVTSLINELHKKLPSDTPPASLHTDSTDASMGREEIQELLHKCKDLLESKDLEVEDVFEKVKELLPFETYKESIIAINEAIQEYDFELAQKEVENLASKLSLRI